MDDVKLMSDSERRRRIPIDGQRKRLLLALQALSPAPVAAEPQQVKFNSTSSLFIDSTITKPCIEEMIFCVSIVIHDRINEGEESAAEASSSGATLPMFDLESKALLQFNAVGGSSERPSEDVIFHTIKSIYAVANFSPECLVISLLFIERLRTLTGIPLLVGNWQPILLASMVVAQKVWDDQSLLNVDFSVICTAYTVQDINKLEKKVRATLPFCARLPCVYVVHLRSHSSTRLGARGPAVPTSPPRLPRARAWQFLELIEYNVSITASLYASYYFELRTLCEKAERDFTLKPLSEDQQRKLESKSSELGRDLAADRRWVSATLPPTQPR